MHAFDRRTDARTDGQRDRNLIARPHLHFMQCGKNATRNFFTDMGGSDYKRKKCKIRSKGVM